MAIFVCNVMHYITLLSEIYLFSFKILQKEKILLNP